jgi:uncharacterized cupredoxin-like copper-binding protein
MVRRLVVSLFVLFLAGGCSSGDADTVGDATASDGEDGGSSVDVTEKDFGIAMRPTTVDAGAVSFKITNGGPSIHEFVVFRTDLAAKNLPLTEDENGIAIVDEEGEGVEAVDEVEDIANGETQTLSVDLEPGSYVAICNLPAHYKQGMRVSFTVA